MLLEKYDTSYDTNENAIRKRSHSMKPEPEDIRDPVRDRRRNGARVYTNRYAGDGT